MADDGYRRVPDYRTDWSDYPPVVVALRADGTAEVVNPQPNPLDIRFTADSLTVRLGDE